MQENSLTLLSNATRMLAEVQTIDDAKQLMDVAASARLYAQKHKLGAEAVGYAREIETRAEIKLSEFLAVMEKNKGNLFAAVKQEDRRDESPTLEEMGITKNLSAEAQMLAMLEAQEQEKIATGKRSKRSVINSERQSNRNIGLQEKSMELPDEIFQVIYCDPPWQYDNSGFDM